MVFGIVAHVIIEKVAFYVFVNVSVSISMSRLSVSVDQLALLTISCFYLVVEKVVHQNLAVLQDHHARVDRLVQKQPYFVHVDACQVIAEYLMPCT